MLKTKKERGVKRGGMLLLSAILAVSMVIPSVALAHADADLENAGGGGTLI